MKCLCFSDSHGNLLTMKMALNKHPNAEVIFFLGDGLSDIDEIEYSCSAVKFLAVRGNCDFRMVALGEIVQKTAEIEISGKRIVYTHGDLYGAKYGTAGLEKLARDRNADIVLFGHTHEPELKYFGDEDKPFYLFNPGSISSGRGSYGILTLTEGQEPFFSHGNFV